MTDIMHDSPNVNILDQLAEKIRFEFGEVNAAGRSRVEHAIAAGGYLLQVRNQIGRGFRRWLAERQLNRTDSYDFMFLAQNAESVRSSGHSSIAAALRELRAKSGRPKPCQKSKSDDPQLSKVAWAKASKEERRQFLNSVGADSLCESLSIPLRAELRRRVGGRQRVATSPLDDTIGKAIRQVLSLQKAGGDLPAASVAAALNAINAKLEAAGMDLNNITVAIDPAMTRRQAA